MAAKTFNHPINHIAISCIDVEGLVSWYTRNLGFELFGKTSHFKRSDQPEIFEKFFVSYPNTLQELKFAALATGNGVGIEVFQFVDPAPKPHDKGFDFMRSGVFHISITDPDPPALLEKLVKDGGKQIGGWMRYDELGLDGHKAIYVQDPWGNVIEIMTLSLERVCSTSSALAWMSEQLQNRRE